MGKRRNKKEKLFRKENIEFHFVEPPDKTKPTRQPIIIPKQLFEAISDFMLQSSPTARNVFLSVAEYSMAVVNPYQTLHEDGPTHLLIFGLRLLNDYFNPIGTVLINKRVDQAEKLTVVWKAFIQDLSILRLNVIGSISRPSPFFHDVLSLLTENPRFNEHTGPITYSVWPYEEIVHIYDCNDLMNDFQDALFDRVDVHFITRPHLSEKTSDPPEDLKLYTASWTDILLTLTSAGIKCSYTVEDEDEESEVVISIFEPYFKKTYKKVSKRDLIATDTKSSTDRLLRLLWPFYSMVTGKPTVTPDFLERLYDDNEDLRIFFATARFRCVADVTFNEPDQTLFNNYQDGSMSGGTTNSSMELTADEMRNIMASLDKSLEAGGLLQTPFDIFLRTFSYDDYDLYVKKSLAVVPSATVQSTEEREAIVRRAERAVKKPPATVQSTEERDAIVRRAERAVAHDHGYFNREKSPLEAHQPLSRSSSKIKEYFDSNNVVQSAFTGRNNFFPSSNMQNNCCKKNSKMEIRHFQWEMQLLKQHTSDVEISPKYLSRSRKGGKKNSQLNVNGSTTSPADASDECLLISYDTPKILGHTCENCDGNNKECELLLIESASVIVKDQNISKINGLSKEFTFCQSKAADGNDDASQSLTANKPSVVQSEKAVPEIINNDQFNGYPPNQNNLLKESNKALDPNNRLLDGLDLANTNSAIMDNMTKFIMSKAMEDFSNILHSYENALDTMTETESVDSLAELFSSVCEEDNQQNKPPPKYMIPKTATDGVKKINWSTSRKPLLQSSRSDSALYIKDHSNNLQKSCYELSLKRNAFVNGRPKSTSPVEELEALLGVVSGGHGDALSEKGLTNSLKNNFEPAAIQGKSDVMNGSENVSNMERINDEKCIVQSELSIIISDNHESAVTISSKDNTPPEPKTAETPQVDKTDKGIDYKEYRKTLMSTLHDCDNKKPNNCDNIFKDKEYFNKLFNSMPKNAEPMQATIDLQCTFKGYLKLKEILERRKVKTFKTKLLNLQHLDYFMSLFKNRNTDYYSTAQGPDYTLIDYKTMLSVLQVNEGLHILSQDEEVKS